MATEETLSFVRQTALTLAATNLGGDRPDDLDGDLGIALMRAAGCIEALVEAGRWKSLMGEPFPDEVDVVLVANTTLGSVLRTDVSGDESIGRMTPAGLISYGWTHWMEDIPLPGGES